MSLKILLTQFVERKPKQKRNRIYSYLNMIYTFCNSFVMTYVGVKCLTRHCSVLRDTLTCGTT